MIEEKPVEKTRFNICILTNFIIHVHLSKHISLLKISTRHEQFPVFIRVKSNVTSLLDFPELSLNFSPIWGCSSTPLRWTLKHKNHKSYFTASCKKTLPDSCWLHVNGGESVGPEEEQHKHVSTHRIHLFSTENRQLCLISLAIIFLMHKVSDIWESSNHVLHRRKPDFIPRQTSSLLFVSILSIATPAWPKGKRSIVISSSHLQSFDSGRQISHSIWMTVWLQWWIVGAWRSTAVSSSPSSGPHCTKKAVLTPSLESNFKQRYRRNFYHVV